MPIRLPRVELALLVVASAVAATLAAPAAATSQWPYNGVPLCAASGDQSSPAAASDSSGGAIVAWCDSRAGGQDIYAQRVDGDGVVQWATQGDTVCTAANAQTSPAVVSDGSHGAFIVWTDSRSLTNPNLYVQHLTAAGTVAANWPVNGLCVCSAAIYPSDAYAVADGLGGVIVVWEDYRSTNGDADVYAQRISADTTRRWTASGAAVCSAPNDQIRPVCIPDGSGGAIFAWQDSRASTNVSDIYVQRLNAWGVPANGWVANGVAASPTEGLRTAINPTLASDGLGGAIVAWEDYRTAYAGIYALRFNANATIPASWVGGVTVCDTINDQRQPIAVPDGSGGAVVLWQDCRSQADTTDLYAKRLTSSGATASGWPPSGSAVCTAPGNQNAPSLVSDGTGGIVAAWNDYRFGSSTKAYAQRLGGEGAVASGWPANGLAICLSNAVQQQPSALPDGSGGALVAWQDNRTGAYKVYATRVVAAGGVLDVAPATGVAFRVHAPRPNPAAGTATFAVELPAPRTVDAGIFDLAGRRVRTLEPGRVLPAGTHPFAWDGRDEAGRPVEPGIYLVRFRAGDEVQVRRAVRLR